MPTPLFLPFLKELKFISQEDGKIITEIIRISPVIIYFFPGIIFFFPYDISLSP